MREIDIMMFLTAQAGECICVRQKTAFCLFHLVGVFSIKPSFFFFFPQHSTYKVLLVLFMCTLLPMGWVVVVIAMEYFKKSCFVTSPNTEVV